MTDRAWAAAQCAAAVASTYEQQRFVLVYGLKETERRCGRNAEDETDVKWNWWTRLRLTLLAQLDRLDTLNAVHLGNHAPRAWASFRSETIGDAAVGFATAGNPRAAETILRRHNAPGGHHAARGHVSHGRSSPRCVRSLRRESLEHGTE